MEKQKEDKGEICLFPFGTEREGKMTTNNCPGNAGADLF